MVLAFGGGVVVLGLEGGSEFDAGLEERAGFAYRLEGAVEFGWPGAVAVSEESVVLAAQPGHLRSEGVGGQFAGLVVEASTLSVTAKYSSATVRLAILAYRKVMSMLRWPSIAAIASSDMPRLMAWVARVCRS